MTFSDFFEENKHRFVKQELTKMQSYVLNTFKDDIIRLLDNKIPVKNIVKAINLYYKQVNNKKLGLTTADLKRIINIIKSEKKEKKTTKIQNENNKINNNNSLSQFIPTSTEPKPHHISTENIPNLTSTEITPTQQLKQRNKKDDLIDEMLIKK